MDIDKAVAELQKSEGKTLISSTDETVSSFKNEGEWFVEIITEYEDGKVDKTHMKMARFSQLYVAQHFAMPKKNETNA